MRVPVQAASVFMMIVAVMFGLLWPGEIVPAVSFLRQVREAGGLVTDIEGGDKMMETGSILAGNPAVHGPLGEAVRQARKQ